MEKDVSQIAKRVFSARPELLHLFDRYADENKFVYLDADTRVYSSFDELDKLLNHNSIILTPFAWSLKIN
ncbi:hypothetical protein PACILC2_24290 [Paenibacillus cisolokensis]|jgi:hypothetical protein|uniref:Uncharacterized protein n=1 Tax=Paenibacillus cisolokensis TaxID=1658519 RepID=A0ABQ4N6Q6_9BACL|nr:hypothetical protein PACILC2_24290 [Paenibacillus cisolokensis]